jgi:putative MFS transporter
VNEAAVKLLGRIERWPITSYHLKIRAFVGTANLFDGIDAMTIGLVLPVLGQMWHLTPGRIGLLISSGFLGQVVGASGFGRLAERYGRIPVLVLTTAIFALASISSALAVGFASMFLLRSIQGLGLGAEVPVASAYLNEIAPAKTRGRFVLLFEFAFAFGIFASGFLGRWIIPAFGWKAMFLAGGIPPLLVLPGIYWSPESPRWLIGRGRIADAEKVISNIEEKIRATGKTLPPPSEFAFPARVAASRWGDLFSKNYWVRTLVIWTMWITVGFISWPVVIWMPSIYRNVFHLPLEKALNYALLNNCIILAGTLCCVFLIDITGRKKWFVGCFTMAAVALIVLGVSGMKTPTQVFALTLPTIFCITSLNLGVWLYTCELYPTRMRSAGCGLGMALSKIAGMIAPPIMGWGIAASSLAGVFIGLGIIAAAAAVILTVLAIETKGRILEEVSP